MCVHTSLNMAYSSLFTVSHNYDYERFIIIQNDWIIARLF